MTEETREALLAGHTRDLEEIRKLRAAAGGTYAVGDWVRSWDNHFVGEVVDVRQPREGGTEEYVVRCPRVRIDTSPRHVLSGDDLAAARVEDSHRAMAVDHLEYILDEIVGAGRSDAVKTVWALLEDIARPFGDGDPDGCSGCGSFSHQAGDCEEGEE